MVSQKVLKYLCDVPLKCLKMRFLCGASEVPFEVPQRTENKNLTYFFLSSSGIGTGRVNYDEQIVEDC